MQTRREWLVSQGLAKPGRGKFSNDAKAALAKAESEGVTFSDAPTALSVRAVDNSPAPAPVKADPKDTLYVCPSDFRYPEGEWVAVARDENGKRILHSVRECCNTCRVSLTNHMCDSPTILGNTVVKMERV